MRPVTPDDHRKNRTGIRRRLLKIALTLTALFLQTLFMTLAISTATVHAESKKYKRSVEKYNIPDVVLVNQDGKKVRLQSFLKGDTPVVVDFIYGTCTTICPVLSAGYLNLQRKLASGGNLPPRLVSITIDPENDSPKVLKEYLKRYQAKPGWDFLTGSRDNIDTVMKAFNAYIPDKMSHYPLNLVWIPKDGTWARLFGILNSREFMDEYLLAVAK
jgi:protein SCO1/2